MNFQKDLGILLPTVCQIQRVWLPYCKQSHKPQQAVVVLTVVEVGVEEDQQQQHRISSSVMTEEQQQDRSSSMISQEKKLSVLTGIQSFWRLLKGLLVGPGSWPKQLGLFIRITVQ
jgi:hypothetical protein